MKLLALADIHGRVNQIPLLADAAKHCDAVVLAGDITDFGGVDQAVSVLSALNAFNIPVLGVPGNCDGSHVEDVLQKQNGSLLQHPVELDGFVFVGFPYTHSDDAVLTVADRVSEQLDGKIVVVSHRPAWGTDVDLQASTRHAGSRSVRSFIEDRQPLLSVSGHIHEARGIDQIGSTLLVNPGPFRNGCYAVINLDGYTVKARLHSL